MKDRSVEFPNRYRLTKVAGTDDIYDLVPAPGDVTEEGTYIKKATLLKDTTAALFGMDENAVPDDVLNMLSGLYQHYWKRRVSESLYERSSFQNSIFMAQSSSSAPMQVIYADDIVILDQKSSDGLDYIQLAEPTTVITVTYDEYEKLSVLAGKYFRQTAETNDATTIIYYGSPTAEPYRETSGSSYRVGLTEWSTWSSKEGAVLGDWETIFSGDINTYPQSGIVDGYEYAYLGVPFDNAVTVPKIATGSYTGTGTYGSSNPNSLTFEFEPKLIIAPWMNNGGDPTPLDQSNTSSRTIVCDMLSQEYKARLGFGTVANLYAKKSSDGRTISWYANSDGAQQNSSGIIFYYIAIG